MTPKQLDQLLGATTWEQFEATAYSSIELHLGGQLTYPVQFRMSTGLYFGKPVQAIMALGQFVRMREFKCDPEDWDMKELDQDNPGLLTSSRRHVFGSGMSVAWAGNLVVSNNILHGVIIT